MIIRWGISLLSVILLSCTEIDSTKVKYKKYNAKDLIIGYWKKTE